MEIIELNGRIAELLKDFEVKDLPNNPNLNGIFEQTDITFAVISGQRADNSNYITIKLNVSIAATLRTKQEQNSYTDEDEKNLYGLMTAVVHKLQKKKIVGGGLIRLLSFENFTPESGKWRSLLTFDVDLPIQSEVDEHEDCIYIKEDVE